MNFFGIEISDAQFEAAMNLARGRLWGEWNEEAIRKALGFEASDVASPPAGSSPWNPWRL
jgi:hypothetical protein